MICDDMLCYDMLCYDMSSACSHQHQLRLAKSWQSYSTSCVWQSLGRVMTPAASGKSLGRVRTPAASGKSLGRVIIISVHLSYLAGISQTTASMVHHRCNSNICICCSLRLKQRQILLSQGHIFFFFCADGCAYLHASCALSILARGNRA